MTCQFCRGSCVIGPAWDQYECAYCTNGVAHEPVNEDALAAYERNFRRWLDEERV